VNMRNLNRCAKNEQQRTENAQGDPPRVSRAFIGV
jgi:hypothetical protein